MLSSASHLKHSFKFTLLLIFLSYSQLSFAQSNFYKFTVGGGFGITLTYPDTKTLISLAGYGSLDYNITPFTTFGAEIQKGKLSGGDQNYGFVNNYTTITLNGKIHVGEFLAKRDFNNFALNSIRGIYLGAGMGLIGNKGVQYNYGTSAINGKDIVFPFNAGSDFYLPNRWGYNRVTLNVNIQAAFFLEDGIDGDLSLNSSFNDVYNYFSVGLKYNLGPLGLYQKR